MFWSVIIMYRTLSWVKTELFHISLFQVDKWLCVNVIATGEIILAWTFRTEKCNFSFVISIFSAFSAPGSLL